MAKAHHPPKEADRASPEEQAANALRLVGLLEEQHGTDEEHEAHRAELFALVKARLEAGRARELEPSRAAASDDKEAPC